MTTIGKKLRGILRRSRSGKRAKGERRKNLSNSLLQWFDIGLAGILFAAPLIMGGRHPTGQFVYIALVFAVATCWMTRLCLQREPRWRWSGAEFLILAVIALLLLQMLPLPSAIVSTLSPRMGQLLPVWSGDSDSPAGLPTWSRLSLTPDGTRLGLVVFSAHALLFLVVVQRLTELSDVKRLLKWIAVAASGMAVLGMLQYLDGTASYLWIYKHPFHDADGAARGTFSNPNHFAHFLALGIGPLIWWHTQCPLHWPKTAIIQPNQISGSVPVGRIATAGALALIMLAGAFSESRGGLAVMGLAAVVGLLLCMRASLLSWGSLLGLAGAGVVALCILVDYGSNAMTTELKDLGALESVEDISPGRIAIWTAVGKAIPGFLPLGSGIGSHRAVYPVYFEGVSAVEYTHAESGYLQILLESGVVGLGLLFWGIAMCGRWCLLGLRAGKEAQGVASCAIAVAAGLLISVLHSVFDFVWYIPACMSLTVLLAACACRLQQLSIQDRHEPTTVRQGWRYWISRRLTTGSMAIPRGGCIICTVFLAGLSIAASLKTYAPAAAAQHWENYIAEAEALRKVAPSRHAQRQKHLGEMTAELEAAYHWNRNDAVIHLHLSALALRQFAMRQETAQNPMDLTQISDAALASNFPDRKSLDQWLETAIGKNRQLLLLARFHALRAVQLSPLIGEAYIYLGKLAFLDNSPRDSKKALMDQALTVRPYNDTVLMAAGEEAVIEGDAETAVALWKNAFHREMKTQFRIIEVLSPYISAEIWLEEFEPGVEAQYQLFSTYQAMERPEDATAIAQQFLNSLPSQDDIAGDPNQIRYWNLAVRMLFQMKRNEQAVRCAEHAVKLAPRNDATREILVRALLDEGQHAEAIKHIEWRLELHPNDKKLRKQLQLAQAEVLAQEDGDEPEDRQAARDGEGDRTGTRAE